MVIGILAIGIGAQILLKALEPLSELLNHRFGIQGVIPANEAAFALGMKHAGNSIVLTFLCGFALHLLLVRLLPRRFYRNIYLTANMMLFLASFMVMVLPTLWPLKGAELVGVGSLLCALYWTFSPSLVRGITKRLMHQPLTLGHCNQLAAYLGAQIGRWVGDPKQDAEKLKLPGGFEIFRDSTVTTATLMPLLFLVSAVVAGKAAIIPYSQDQNWLIWCIMQGFSFAAGMFVLLSGVRLFIGSMIPAFEGITRVLIPGAVPALDCTTFFPFSPVASLLGFIAAIGGALASMGLLMLCHSKIIVFPSPIIMFFDGGLIGVFANRSGGVRGTLVAGFVMSLIGHLGYLLVYPMTGVLVGSGITFSNIDDTLLWMPLYYLAKWLTTLF
ncbi:PTS transporter subunit IIC [Dongshaea marina]|uniref:PTS transporter subunit IIC n=1 Tax=Dongshaea marina TaxID=2047966 RepID=UPI000D3E523B|nr:PTS transporter subunit IIC [Dongshaea marina]